MYYNMYINFLSKIGDTMKKTNTIILIMLSLLFLLIVQILFSIPAPYQWLDAVWDAGDFIIYIGTIGLGILVYEQNQQNNKHHKELLEQDFQIKTKSYLKPNFLHFNQESISTEDSIKKARVFNNKNNKNDDYDYVSLTLQCSCTNEPLKSIKILRF